MEQPAVYRERRYMRHFVPGPVASDTLARPRCVPAAGKPVAILSIGHVEAFYPRPLLYMAGWKQGRPVHEFLCENTWDRTTGGAE
jgi:hypothetical protein